jgi:DNA-binding NarL/FixJ family response regulator
MVNYKVLIVDDSKLARMAVIRALKHSCPNCQRVEAGSAIEAMSAMQSEPPNIALVDFNMPGTDGLKLAADLRKLEPNMAIAVVSANHQQEIINRTHALGATFLPKPLADKALAEFIETAMRDLQGVNA